MSFNVHFFLYLLFLFIHINYAFYIILSCSLFQFIFGIPNLLYYLVFPFFIPFNLYTIYSLITVGLGYSLSTLNIPFNILFL